MKSSTKRATNCLCQNYWICNAKNAVISASFLVWKCCGKARFPQSFGRIARDCAETVPFHKIYAPKLDEITVFYAVMDIMEWIYNPVSFPNDKIYSKPLFREVGWKIVIERKTFYIFVSGKMTKINTFYCFPFNLKASPCS